MSYIPASIDELFTIRQLAEFLHKKPSTIYSDLIRRPESLPPIFRAPGSSRLLFVNPRQWVAELLIKQQGQAASSAPIQSVKELKKRGRPSTVELAKRNAALASSAGT